MENIYVKIGQLKMFTEVLMKDKDQSAFTFEEINFLKELDILNNEELEKKYDLLLNAKKLSTTEL
ncbi:MAG: hypothetical protein ACQET8_19035 [Bacillota bacterium]